MWYDSSGRWLDADLMASAQTGALAEVGTGVAAVDGSNLYFVATDQTVHKMWYDGTRWWDADLMASAQTEIRAEGTVMISGDVLAGGAGLSGVTVSLSGTRTFSALTDSNGHYSFYVPDGGTYTVTLSLAEYTFSPASQTFDVVTGNQAADTTSASPGQPATSPPSISNLSLPSGPPQMGFVINGANFGGSQGVVTFNDSTALTVISWGDSSIKVQIPAGTPTGNGRIAVTTAGAQTSTATFNVTDPFGCS